jgi:hypothetical protein
MGEKSFSSSEMKQSREPEQLKDLRRLLGSGGNYSEEEVLVTWSNLKRMQKELELLSLSPIKQYYSLYQKLEEIRKALNLFSADFIQLNQLHIEITTLRELTELPESTPISEIISLIQQESLDIIPSLGARQDALLLKVLLLHILQGVDDQNELNSLRKLENLKNDNSVEVVINTWYFIKKMQEELEIPSLYPIKQHYYFYQKLEEIRKELNLSSADFIQLNQLYIEITTLREILKLPETTPISEIISLIRKEPLAKIASLGVKYDSLLLKVLLLQSTTVKRNSIDIQKRLAIINDLDSVLFEILKSYGPLSRPELVELTGIARSSIYDSLRRLMVKGFVVQYSEQRSHTGRPTTVFDALI